MSSCLWLSLDSQGQKGLHPGVGPRVWFVRSQYYSVHQSAQNTSAGLLLSDIKNVEFEFHPEVSPASQSMARNHILARFTLETATDCEVRKMYLFPLMENRVEPRRVGTRGKALLVRESCLRDVICPRQSSQLPQGPRLSFYLWKLYFLAGFEVYFYGF